MNTHPSTYQADAALKAMINRRTNIITELMEMPAEYQANHPWCIIYPMFSLPFEGDWENSASMVDLPYQLSVGGYSHEQVAKAAERITVCLVEHWADVPQCCGQPEVSRGGIVRDEDRLYRAILTTTLKVSGA